MPEFCGFAVSDKEIDSQSNLTQSEKIKFERNGTFLVIKSNSHDTEAYGLGSAFGKVTELHSSGESQVLNYTAKAKYFDDVKKVPLCRAVLVAKVAIGASTDLVFTSAYNVNESGNNPKTMKQTVQLQSEQDGSQCHAEMWCIFRLKTLLKQIIGFKRDRKAPPISKDIITISGIIRIEGLGKMANTACTACSKELDKLTEVCKSHTISIVK